MGLCCGKLFKTNCNNQSLIHPAQPVYFNIPHYHRPSPYNPASYQFREER
jgi:hypothetical protein